MENGRDNQDGVSNILRKQLAFALRGIQWSYAIFWSISSKNPGMLEWKDGHYNGDVKTRKTLQAAEVDPDEMGFQRSEQLRELFLSFKAGDSAPPAPRPSVALSPEDLTDTEWYYLVCMSFSFNIGQGLPGKTYAKNRPIWLCNAHQTESTTFTRSLLAKSASIQTVVCFPHLGGVLELGVTDQVSEDLNLIQHTKVTYLDIPFPSVDERARNDKVFTTENFDHALLEAESVPLVEGEGAIIYSSNNTSNGFGHDRRGKASCMIEGINAEASQVPSWDLINNEFGDHANNSINSSGSLSENFVEKMPLLPDGEKRNDACLREIQEYDEKEMNSSDPPGKDIYYQSVLSNLLKSSHQLILGPYFGTRDRESGFDIWKMETLRSFQKPQSGSSQRLLKKVLIEVAKMHSGSLVESSKANCIRETTWRHEADEIVKNSVFSGKKRREEINQRFMILSSSLPTNSKVDKISILDHTIEYLKDLERRINELESQKEVVSKTGRKNHDAVERTYESEKGSAYKMDDIGPSKNRSLPGDISTGDVSVSVIDKDITIEMCFPWRDGALLDIMEVMSNLHLDSHTIQSTNIEGIFSVTIKSKLKGSKNPSTGMITQALQNVIWNRRMSPPHQFHT